VLEYDFENSLGYWICRAAHQFERAINAELEPTGITYRQCQVLGWLALEGELSQTELADKMRIEPPTLVGILDRMEREGWITREGDPADRRKKMIHVRPKAKPVWDKIVACAKRVRVRARRGLSPAEQRTLKRLLEKVQENLGAASLVKEAV
jgi:MarR family transcriptional regulator, transcriptional regulator for hemolysin